MVGGLQVRRLLEEGGFVEAREVFKKPLSTYKTFKDIPIPEGGDPAFGFSAADTPPGRNLWFLAPKVRSHLFYFTKSERRARASTLESTIMPLSVREVFVNTTKRAVNGACPRGGLSEDLGTLTSTAPAKSTCKRFPATCCVLCATCRRTPHSQVLRHAWASIV